MTNTDRRKRALLARAPKARKWDSTETDAYHERMQALMEERAALRRAKQREILRGIGYSDIEEDE